MNTYKSVRKPGLNLPLDVVDTGFDSYQSRIEDGAGIGIAMCFTHDDATAITRVCNAHAALVEALAASDAELWHLITRRVPRSPDEHQDRERWLAIHNANVALTPAQEAQT
jgi:hypothetical protein